MMGAARDWLLSVIAASLICALADALMPQGAVRRVGRLVCGLVLLWAVLSPLAGLDMSGGRQWVEDCMAALELREAELSETVNGQMKVIIEQEYGAYIVDKAAQLGLSCCVQVECCLSEEGLYLPVRVRVSGALTQSGQAQILRIIAEDLGIPESEQLYTAEEDVP